MNTTVWRMGGCLCGALRYRAEGPPDYAGHCYCADCRKASGSGFIPFMGYRRGAVAFSGPSVSFASPSRRGSPATRNFCPACMSLVFGGERDAGDAFTIYAGTLDDPALFQPAIAIFTRGAPDWAVIPADLRVFEDGPQ